MSGFTERLPVWFGLLRASLSKQHGLRRMSAAFIDRVWLQTKWLERRLLRAIARVDAGIKPRIRRPRPKPFLLAPPAADTQPGDGHPAQPPAPILPCRPPAPRKLRLPRREGWLVPLMPSVMLYQWVWGASTYGSDLANLLAAPQIAPYLVHPSIVRQLRPLCRMLGISHLLPPKPPRAAPPDEAPPACSDTVPEAPSAASPPAPSPVSRLLRRRRPTSHPPPLIAPTFGPR